MTDAYDLPDGFTVTFRIRQLALEAEWSPRLPAPNEFLALLESYRGAREQFLKRLGPDVVVIER